ncbi:MAG TPA: AAA family ATPase [Ilumatobacteraceae bacterium]|nr:AAA family ATPase [Ilumatobacteraceae bacterium]
MTGSEGERRDSVRAALRDVGFVPNAATTYPPPPGLVSRSSLVDDVVARRPDVVVVTAPAGYGKSSFVAELAQRDPRPTAWVSLGKEDNEPATLLACIALAINDIEPVDGRLVAAFWPQTPTVGTRARQAFGAMLSARQRPFVLVLDDTHELVDRDAIDTVALLVGELPAGSSIVLAGREQLGAPLGRVRAQRRLVEIGATQLAFDPADATALLAGLGIDASPRDIARLVERTEGWPAALYLAGLAHGARPGPVATLVDEFGGDHRFLVEYLGEELLGTAGTDEAAFMMDASCLGRMSGPLCDDVLGRSGSAALLETVRGRNLLVIPLDDRREWYRFHHLLAEFLQAELARRDPQRRSAIHRRASEWFHARGDADGAVSHAVLAGDLDRAEALVMQWFGRYAVAGHNQTIERWVRLFSDDELRRHPGLMVSAAHARFSDGDPEAALQWLARAGEALPELRPPGADGPVAPVLLAAARAIIAPAPAAEMAADARYAHERVGHGEGHPLSCLGLGAAAFALGDEDEARRRLREGAASTLQRPVIEATCLAHLAVIDVEHGQWEAATTSARRARAMVTARPGPTAALVLAMSVLVETRAGRADDAEDDRQLCRQHLTGLLGVAPWINVQARLALARAAALRGNRVEAGALTGEAASILTTMAGAEGVVEQLAALRRLAAPGAAARGFGPSSLSTAELRVLQLLPTHLSAAEIAERLYVSRSTVKTQTIAIYRKLGTSSRSGAVEIAAAAGLLHDARQA